MSCVLNLLSSPSYLDCWPDVKRKPESDHGYVCPESHIVHGSASLFHLCDFSTSHRRAGAAGKGLLWNIIMELLWKIIPSLWLFSKPSESWRSWEGSVIEAYMHHLAVFLHIVKTLGANKKLPNFKSSLKL